MRRIFFRKAKEFKKFFLAWTCADGYKMFGCFLVGEKNANFFVLPLYSMLPSISKIPFSNLLQRRVRL